MAWHWRTMGQRQDVRRASLPSLADAHSLCSYVSTVAPPARSTREGQTCTLWHSQSSHPCLPCPAGSGIARSTQQFWRATNCGLFRQCMFTSR
eukprot:6401452-Pyramimonas_sp.AAC.1